MRRKITAVIALTSTACTTWQAQYAPPKTVVEKESDAGPIRVWLTTGPQVVIHKPQIVGDSVIGFKKKPIEGETIAQASPNRVAVATADIVNVSTKKIAVGRTVLALTGVALAIAIITAPSGGGGGGGDAGCAPSGGPTYVQPQM